MPWQLTGALCLHLVVGRRSGERTWNSIDHPAVRQALALLGRETHDVYLNDRAYWKNVPAGVWEYTIGGYQVVKKWLSYRERELLGRPFRSEEAREVTAMPRRLAAIILLQPALDENYRRVKAHTYAWPAKP